MKVIVILLCGVPACGKSTFVKAFLAYLQTQPTLIPRVISYDKISEQLDWNEESFINARQQAKSQLLGFLQEISLSSNEQSKDPTNLILIDDTMHLRSMRREIYVITRDHSIPLLTLWLNIDPSIALERNRFRNLYENGNVSEESFLRVSETFQPPDPSFIFDRYSMMIQSDVTQYRFDEVFTLIMKRMNEFALELAEKRQRQENERNLQTSQQQLRHQPKDSKIYDLDDRLRKMISEIVCWWKEIITDIHRKSLLKDLTKMLSEKKQSVLERIRYDVHHCDTFLDSNYIQSFVFDVCEDLSCQLAKTIDPSTNLLLSQLLNVLDQLLLV